MGRHQATKAIHKVKGPVYMRIGSGRDPVVDSDIPFELGKVRILKEDGGDVAILANGFVINRALEAADNLKAEGINAVVLDVHTLKPLDEKGIIEILKKTGAAVTVEDHNIIGGLGSAITELSAEKLPCPVVRIGLRDLYPRSGQPGPLLDYYKMSATDIVEAAKRAIKTKK